MKKFDRKKAIEDLEHFVDSDRDHLEAKKEIKSLEVEMREIADKMQAVYKKYIKACKEYNLLDRSYGDALEKLKGTEIERNSNEKKNTKV
jgi:hypothetical protein